MSVPVVLANKSLCAAPSEMMAASPAGARSKVRVPEEVNCPDGDIVTVGRRSRCGEIQDFIPDDRYRQKYSGHVTYMWFLKSAGRSWRLEGPSSRG